jgi:uncharacterized protein with von Willebrand factor type A (vWA) domain
MAVKVADKDTKLDVELVRAWADRLGLSHWNIKLVGSDEKLEDETQAATDVQAPYHEAMITTGPNFPENPEEQEEIIVHELSHILVAGMSRAGDNLAQAAASSSRHALSELFSDAEETTVSSLTRLFLNVFGTART